MASKITVTYIDGTTETATIITPDRIRFDMARTRNGWPSMQDAPFLGMAYWVWAALKRTQKTDLDFDSWVENVDDMGEPAEVDTNPTSQEVTFTS